MGNSNLIKSKVADRNWQFLSVSEVAGSIPGSN